MKKIMFALILLTILSMIGSLVWIFFEYDNYIPYMIYTIASIGVWIMVYFYGKSQL